MNRATFAVGLSAGAAALSVVSALLLASCSHDRASPRERVARDSSELFSLRVLPKFYIELDDAALASLGERPREYVRGNLRYAGKTYGDIGVRLKGHRSMQGFDRKPAFKLRFDKFRGKQRFLGLRRLTLNNMVEDPTMLRELLAYRLHRTAGVHAPRIGYAQVYVNNELYGLYLNVESIDDDFVFERAAAGGSVYEGEYGCDLYPDDVPGFDRDAGGHPEHYDLRALARAAQGSIDELFYAPDSPLDRHRVLAFLAVSAYIGDFDGYRHGHNYRFFRDTASGTWSIVPWGLDRALRRDMDLYDSGGLLAKRCFAHPRCRADYNAELRRVAALADELALHRLVDEPPRFVDLAAQVDRRRPYSRRSMAKARTELRAFLTRRSAAVRRDTNLTIVRNPDGRCTEHQVGGARFSLCATPMAWDEAAAYCRAHGYRLARVDNEVQARALFELAVKRRNDKWWLGASDRGHEGQFRWTDGQALSYARWARGEPDNSGCNQDCVAIHKRGGGIWHDTHCALRHPFICRAPGAVAVRAK